MLHLWMSHITQKWVMAPIWAHEGDRPHLAAACPTPFRLWKYPPVLQCVAVCCRVMQCDAVCCSMLQCVAVCCSMLQCVAVCCSVLQCAAVCCSVLRRVCCGELRCVTVCYVSLDPLSWHHNEHMSCHDGWVSEEWVKSECGVSDEWVMSEWWVSNEWVIRHARAFLVVTALNDMSDRPEWYESYHLITLIQSYLPFDLITLVQW